MARGPESSWTLVDNPIIVECPGLEGYVFLDEVYRFANMYQFCSCFADFASETSTTRSHFFIGIKIRTSINGSFTMNAALPLSREFLNYRSAYNIVKSLAENPPISNPAKATNYRAHVRNHRTIFQTKQALMVEALLPLVNWVSMRRTGTGLPMELLEMVRSYIRRGGPVNGVGQAMMIWDGVGRS